MFFFNGLPRVLALCARTLGLNWPTPSALLILEGQTTDATSNHTYGNAFAASRTCSGCAILKKFSVTIRQRIVPDESIRNSAGRAMPAPLATSSRGTTTE